MGVVVVYISESWLVYVRGCVDAILSPEGLSCIDPLDPVSKRSPYVLEPTTLQLLQVLERCRSRHGC